MKKTCLLLLTLFSFSYAGLHAQVSIGGTNDPTPGTLLDLNTAVKGALLLSSVDIRSLDSIPAGNDQFPGIILPDSMDTNWSLRGAVVYNTSLVTGPGIYVWTGKYWRSSANNEPDNDQIYYKIRTTKNTYYLPTRGYVGGTYNHAYDWDISIDDGPYERKQGTSSDAGGITLSLPAGNDHLIRIIPHNAPAPGWGNAFGHGSKVNEDADKIISIEAPLTTRTFAPKATESNASYMFAYLFNACTNLIAPAKLKDNYKLPETVTDLSYFFSFAYEECKQFIASQDFTPLSAWLSGNNSIKNLSNFLRAIHYNNTSLKDPINLTPFADWFRANTSITDLSFFFRTTHQYCGNLQNPMNLSPLSGWFNANTSITNLSNFFNATYHKSSSLKDPMNLSPLSGWFNMNTSITNLSNFFNGTYQECDKLTAPINLIPLSSWFRATGTTINNLTGFLYQTHLSNLGLKLSGQKIFPEWIRNLKGGSSALPIKDVPDAFGFTFGFDVKDNNKNDDTGEPQFEQNGDPLSSLGAPTGTASKGTYQKRTYFNYLHENWR